MSFKKYFLPVFLLLSSCATITSDKPYPVKLESPSGSKVEIDGVPYDTSRTVMLKPQFEYNITVRKECYRTVNFTSKGDFRIGAAIFGNILWGVIPGLAVDLLTRDAFKPEPIISIPDLERNYEDKNPRCAKLS